MKFHFFLLLRWLIHLCVCSCLPLCLIHSVAPAEPLLCKFADGGQKKRQTQVKYPQNGRPWTREGEVRSVFNHQKKKKNSSPLPIVKAPLQQPQQLFLKTQVEKATCSTRTMSFNQLITTQSFFTLCHNKRKQHFLLGQNYATADIL